MDQHDERSGDQGGAGGAGEPSTPRSPRPGPRKPPSRPRRAAAPPRPPAPEPVPVPVDAIDHDLPGAEPEPPAPEPVFVEPEPVFVEPEPVFVEPEPVFVEPEPVFVEPEPVFVEPEPVFTEPVDAPVDAYDDGYEDTWEDDEAYGEPWYGGRFGRTAVLVVGGLVVLLVGYTIGWSRGSAGVDQGSSPTTSIVKNVNGGGSTDTAPQTTAAPAVPMAMPFVNQTVVNFDDGIPGDVDGHTVEARGGEWTTVNGAATPSEPAPLVDGATDPRLMGQGPDLLVDAGAPVSIASTKFATPTALSGVVARYKDDGNYWAAVADVNLTHITLYEVKDGQQKAVGFVDAEVVPGMVIAIIDVDGQVGLAVDGTPKLLSTFFGPKAGLPDDGIDGTRVGLITGGGAPAFDELSFG